MSNVDEGCDSFLPFNEFIVVLVGEGGYHSLALAYKDRVCDASDLAGVP